MAVKKQKVTVNSRELLYVSNILSLSRVIILPFIIIGLLRDHSQHRLFTVSLMLVAIVTDALDGFLARRLGKVSALGKILDPVADKLCIGTVGLTVACLKDLPWWAVAFILFRDFLIIIGGIIMVEKWTVITSSNIWGKATSFFQSVAIMAYAFEIPYRSYPLTVALGFTSVSTVSYFIEFYNLSREVRRTSAKDEKRI